MTQLKSADGADKSFKQPDRADGCFNQQKPGTNLHMGSLDGQGSVAACRVWKKAVMITSRVATHLIHSRFA